MKLSQLRLACRSLCQRIAIAQRSVPRPSPPSPLLPALPVLIPSFSLNKMRNWRKFCLANHRTEVISDFFHLPRRAELDWQRSGRGVAWTCWPQESDTVTQRDFERHHLLEYLQGIRLVMWPIILKFPPWFCGWPTNHINGFKNWLSDWLPSFKFLEEIFNRQVTWHAWYTYLHCKNSTSTKPKIIQRFRGFFLVNLMMIKTGGSIFFSSFIPESIWRLLSLFINQAFV